MGYTLHTHQNIAHLLLFTSYYIAEIIQSILILKAGRGAQGGEGAPAPPWDTAAAAAVGPGGGSYPR